jgi:hypothetical protein
MGAIRSVVKSSEKGSSKMAPEEGVKNQQPGRKPCQEQDHENDEQIDRYNFPFREVFPVFSSNPNPNMLNAATGAMFRDSHHVKGEGVKTLKDFRDFKCVFCLEWVKLMIGDLPYWVRCSNQYNLKSPGCTDHPKVQFKDGPNQLYTLLFANKTATWGMLRNAQLENEPRPLTLAEQRAKVERESEEIGEQIAVTKSKGEDIKELQIKFQLSQQLLAQLSKNNNSRSKNRATPQQTGGIKALPAVSTEGLRVRGGSAGVLNNRQKAKDSAPGNQALDNKRFVTQNPKNNHKSKVWLNTLKSVAEEPPTQRKKPKQAKREVLPAGPDNNEA